MQQQCNHALSDPLVSVIEQLVDLRVGIIKYLKEQPRFPEFPELFHYVAESCNTEAFSGQCNFRHTGGASTRRDLAMAKAMGESIERYCSALFERYELPLTSAVDASFKTVAVEQFALNSKEQYDQTDFPWKQLTPKTPIRWSPALDLLADKTLYVPAAFVYVPYYYYLDEGDTPIGQPISTGLACHRSLTQAAISGICEVLERDAFTLTWQARISPPRIRPESLPTHLKELLQRLTKTRATVDLFVMTMDHGVPTVIAVQRHESLDMPAITFSAASALDPGEAVRKSLEELPHTGRWMYTLKQQTTKLDMEHFYINIDSQETHLRFWNYHENRSLADFVFESENVLDFGELPNLDVGEPRRNLRILCEQIASVGYQILLADLTTPDVRDVGLSVVRALIPGFHPLIMGHSLRALGGKRLWTVPQHLGFKGVTPTIGDNPVPHPFP
ncbi:MAG: YcaO-like family protein [Nostoc sp.]